MQSLFHIAFSQNPHSGSYRAGIASTTQQFISQVLPTEAGQEYELSFWLRLPGPFAPPPGTGPYLNLSWEGQGVSSIQLSGPSSIVWSQYTFPIHADITGSFLEFGQNAFPGEIHIDDISVAPIPTPSAAAVLLMGGAVAAMRRRRR